MMYSIDRVRDILGAAYQASLIEFAGSGDHSEAFRIDSGFVIKLPKHKAASDCLKTEFLVLQGLVGKTCLEIPQVVFEGSFIHEGQRFIYSIAKMLSGRKLSKPEFMALDERTTAINAKRLALFLHQVHSERQLLPAAGRDWVLLHGDFSLDHILFDVEGLACGVLDFGDSRTGCAMCDFTYLLDDEDCEEFGAAFGERVLREYLRLSPARTDVPMISGVKGAIPCMAQY